MMNFQRKDGWRNIFQSKPFLILLGILILFFGYNVVLFSSKMSETSQNKKIVEEKVAELRKQKEKLKSDINSLNTEEGKEKIFRENFGLAKEGEEMIVIVDDKNTQITPKSDSSSGFLSFVKSIFKF